MSNIVPFGGSPDDPGIPQAFVIPEFDRRLTPIVDDINWPHPDQPAKTSFHPGAVAAAAHEIETLVPLLHPASLELVGDWLEAVAGAVRNAPPAADLAARKKSLWISAQTIPAGAWTLSTLREGLATWTWFPAVAEVVALVTRDLRPLHDRIFALRRIVKIGSKPALAVVEADRG
jgi:hypothetical protein